ncbi:uncharacterized protein DEA37_0013201 [Paragonimus westermani]|uniref:BPTI/Kunitz inhibitor domain-containing protein n=1 Tax=Paragonimus westermani TaxID=34504 RepID=A0A5J4NH28_9TREM|nr:uncharacterized protein DEA37_0001215 [Paragonimus westermani]KAA3674724.1 uncharacterized protein DEA37_0013201 [Paragonimus westermani]
MYGYNPSEGGCVPFIYHGFGGNGNRFDIKLACDNACH